MKAKVETITVEKAKRMLGKNSNFRRINEKRVSDLARDITSNRWEINGESIKFDVNGNLVDGQHRLAAIVKADQPISTVVVREIEGALEIDHGVGRTLAQNLTFLGEKNAAVLAAVIRKYWLWKNDRSPGESGPRLSVREGINLLRRNPGFRHSVEVTVPIRRSNIITHSALAFLHYMFARKDEDLADDFIGVLTGDVAVGPNDPVNMLREKLIRNRVGNRRTRLSRVEILALGVKAWNAWRENRTLKQLSWCQVGTRAEPFPEIR